MKIIAALLIATVGYFGAMAVESNHQERHVQKIEARYGW
jgi:hypothetical protein